MNPFEDTDFILQLNTINHFAPKYDTLCPSTSWIIDLKSYINIRNISELFILDDIDLYITNFL